MRVSLLFFCSALSCCVAAPRSARADASHLAAALPAAAEGGKSRDDRPAASSAPLFSLVDGRLVRAELTAEALGLERLEEAAAAAPAARAAAAPAARAAAARAPAPRAPARALSAAAQVLTDGQPVTGASARGALSFYSFTATRRDLPVSLVVTPSSGDPDLYVSTLSATPNASAGAWQWRSVSARGADVVVLGWDAAPAGLGGCAAPCVIYLGVLAYGGPASFSVVASAAARTALTAGVPAGGLAAPWAFAYYELSLPATPGWPPAAVEFALTPLGGARAYLYVNAVPFNYTGTDAQPVLSCSPAACPNTPNWVVRNAPWSSFSSASTQRVVIAPSDAGYRVGTYIVGVLAPGGASAPFTLVGYLGGGFATLQDGVPLQDSVALGAYAFYRLVVSTWGADVSVQVTANVGDPDLFVSVHAANRVPNASAYDATSRAAAGVDAVFFAWSQLDECRAAIAPDGSGGSCDIWIGVQGYSAATFSVVGLVVDGQHRTLLLDGLPQGGVVGYRQMAYYEARVAVAPGAAYSLYVRALAGDADVYARTDGQTPRIDFYQFASTRATGDEIINISPASQNYQSNCTLAVAVYGYTNATYAITYASSTAVVELLNGIGQGGIVAATPAYSYFYIAVPTAGTDVFFVLTALAGDADIYVGVWSSPTFRPSVTSWTWKGDAYGSDAVFIAGSDPRACGACNYIIAVTCAVGTSCAFAVGAIVAPATVAPLVSGQPVASAVAGQASRYFSFDTGGVLANVTFACVALTGDVELYVTNKRTPPLPDPGVRSSWIWASAVGGNATGSGVVFVPTTDPAASPPARFTVAAFCVTGPCAFGIVALAAGGAPQTLLPGSPTAPASLPAGGTQAFVLTLTDTSKDLVLDATALEGDVMIAMSPPTQPPPACGPTVQGLCTGTWVGAPADLRVIAAAPCGGANTVGPCTSTDWAPGQFSILVFAPAGAVYTLVALSAAVPTRLVDGAPQDGVAAITAPPTYAYQTPTDASLPDVRISVSSTGIGPSARALVVWLTSCFESACTAASSAPGPGNHLLAAAVPAGGTVDLFISRFSPAYCAPPPAGGSGTCNYFVSVDLAAPCPGACMAPLTIVAQRQGGALTRVPFFAVDNVTLTQPGNVAPGRAAVYELYLAPNPALSVTARLDACGPAQLNLYSCDPSAAAPVRCANPFAPRAGDNSAAAATAAGGGTARLPAPAVTSSTYFLAVANDGGGSGAAAGPSSYSLTLSAGGAATLWPGTTSALTVTVAGDVANISWAPARVGSPTAPGPGLASGVAYTVFAAPGGFAAASPAGVVPTTACGLLRWAALVPPSVAPPVSVVDTTETSLRLLSNTYYEFAVIAACDRACWARSVQAMRAAGLAAPGYAVQRVAYSPGANSTSSGDSVPVAAAGFPIAGMVGIGLAAAALASAGFAVFRYRRLRAADSSSQYAALDERTMSGAMATIAVPAGPWPTGGRGFMASIKKALAPPASGSLNDGGGGGGGGGGSGGDVYSELPEDGPVR